METSIKAGTDSDVLKVRRLPFKASLKGFKQSLQQDKSSFNYTINQLYCFVDAPHNGDSLACVKMDCPIFYNKGILKSV